MNKTEFKTVIVVNLETLETLKYDRVTIIELVTRAELEKAGYVELEHENYFTLTFPKRCKNYDDYPYETATLNTDEWAYIEK